MGWGTFVSPPAERDDVNSDSPRYQPPRELPLSDDLSPQALGEKLDHYYMRQKASGELQTTEIPISMLAALDHLSGKKVQTPEEEKQGPNASAKPKESGLTAHLRRVAAYAHLLALKLGLPESEAHLVMQVCPMHDIGKWMIPSHILEKPSALTPDEWEVMKTHARAGYDMLKDSQLEVMKLGALVAIQHQEKFDGTGYPLGLKGDQIHLYSRITTVVDVFDALGSARSYKDAWPIDDIVHYFQQGRGTHFDPHLVDLLLGNLEHFLEVRASFSP
jgi:HD-GYP domain-containing protein (c-di-GMP phosphodiesterase class II)